MSHSMPPPRNSGKGEACARRFLFHSSYTVAFCPILLDVWQLCGGGGGGCCCCCCCYCSAAAAATTAAACSSRCTYDIYYRYTLQCVPVVGLHCLVCSISCIVGVAAVLHTWGRGGASYRGPSCALPGTRYALCSPPPMGGKKLLPLASLVLAVFDVLSATSSAFTRIRQNSPILRLCKRRRGHFVVASVAPPPSPSLFPPSPPFPILNRLGWRRLATTL